MGGFKLEVLLSIDQILTWLCMMIHCNIMTQGFFSLENWRACIYRNKQNKIHTHTHSTQLKSGRIVEQRPTHPYDFCRLFSWWCCLQPFAQTQLYVQSTYISYRLRSYVHMLRNYTARFLPWVSLAHGGAFLYCRKALFTAGCQLSLILKYILSMLCAIRKCVMKMLPSTPTDSPPRGGCVHLICAAHKLLHLHL